MSTDAVDCFIQERDDMDYADEDFEETILHDPLMQNELLVQQGIITYLNKIDMITVQDISTLLQLQEKSSIALKL